LFHGTHVLSADDPEAFTCTTNQTEIASGSQKCPQENKAVPIFSAVYMLLANILLLNLLIAMFRSVIASHMATFRAVIEQR